MSDDREVSEINIKEVCDEILDGCSIFADPASFDPAFFIRDRIRKTVEDFTSDPGIRSRITYDAKIRIDTTEVNLNISRTNWVLGEYNPMKKDSQIFTLAEVCTDYHLRALKGKGFVEIQWPSYYPEELIKTFTEANYQTDFREHVANSLKHPAAHALGCVLKNNELKNLVIAYVKDRTRAMEYRYIAAEYHKGKITPRVACLHSDPGLEVDNVVFIGPHNLSEGILFFLGDDNKAIELPAGHDARGRFLESNVELQKLLLKRVPLNAQSKPGVSDFKWEGLRPAPMFSIRATYRELVFRHSDDIGKDLFDRQIKRALTDIDTLVSTYAERVTDFALEAVGYLLQCLSIVVLLPAGGAGALASAPMRMLIPFLLGLGASATDLIRAEISDDPLEADRLRISASIGVLAELAGPVAERIIGRGLSIIIKKRIGRQVRETLTLANLPSSVRGPVGDIRQLLASTAGKEIPRAGKGPLVAGPLAALATGPNVAQSLATQTQVVRHAGPNKGYVYQGFVFRGDMRDPAVIFEKGFTQRTPISDINQVNGFKGGYGGAHDALDLDGAGISTSAFYKKDGAGAFVYGGQKGGFTYFIDARQMEGFHLYANTELAFRPNSTLNLMPPLEINFAVDLPPALILGAYDGTGKFISNPNAISQAIKVSEADSLEGLGRIVAKELADSTKGDSDKSAPQE